MYNWVSIWHYPPQYRVGSEINRNIPSFRFYWRKLQNPWPRSNIPYTALELPYEVTCLEKKKPKQETSFKANSNSIIVRKLSTLPNTGDTVRYNIALMTSTSRVFISYPLGTIIKWCHMKTWHRFQHPKGGRKV